MKLRITESQYKRLQENINADDNKYRKNVNVKVYGVTYKGFEINDIVSPKIMMKYDIDVEARSWGIKGISLFGIQGPDKIEVEVSYYNNGDDSTEETVIIDLDWTHAHIQENPGMGNVSIGDEIEVYLDENFKVVKLLVEVDKF